MDVKGYEREACVDNQKPAEEYESIDNKINRTMTPEIKNNEERVELWNVRTSVEDNTRM
ncbi:13881_t:CDS:2 [Dentiscutata erythropus]|uniref:13881_t:CDS:1 n=1 Tax=Dentiscutata erythropus TaxID=1348616 RepID=A0A9N9G780_9GLOM|nr:13881_t:CDS:2 [Dentiscutata erythropus]